MMTVDSFRVRSTEIVSRNLNQPRLKMDSTVSQPARR
jgi:hypothetical protein